MSFNIDNFKDILKQEFPGAHYEDGKLTRNEPVTCTIISKELETDPHYHEHIELIYVTNSELEADVNKKKIMVRSGDMLVLIPGDVHNYKLKNNCSYACIHADIDFLFSGILSNSDLHYSMPYTLAKEYIESGKIKALATLMSQPLPATPDIPTAQSSGLPHLTIDTLYGILAPKGTDAAIVEKLNAAILKIVNTNDEYKQAIRNYNFQEPYALNVKDSIERLKGEREHMMSYSKYLQ